MSNIAAPPQIASAAAVFYGRHGDVTRLARQRGVCRQRLYRDAHAVAAAIAGNPARQRLRRLRQCLGHTRQRLADAQRQLRHTVRIDAERQAQFAATAQALGVSLTAAHALLAVLLPATAPSVSRLGRLAQDAGRRARAVLGVLDAFSRPKARQVAADELFSGRRPVLVTLEQDSLCWLGGRLAPCRDGPQWAEEFRPLPHAEQVTRDGGHGLRKGLAQVNRERQRAGRPAIADQEDHFHLLQRARRALREVRAKAVRAFRQAEAAQRGFDRDRWRGIRRSAAQGHSVRLKWSKAQAAWDRWAVQERAFERLRQALRLFTPEGQLNTRARGQAEVQAALAQLTGPEWARPRRRLAAPEAFTFLDRVGTQLAAVPVAAEVRDVLVHGEGLRRQPEALRGDSPRAAALRGVAVVAGVVAGLLGEAGPSALQAVRAVLGRAWRSSSLVEGLNSVLRMQQRRQKRLTQGLLDLKRLHWNMHVFAAGRRKGTSPYERLGIVLPPGSWWHLLKIPPELLRQQLSALNRPT
jgi:hypothetical protein